MGLKLNNLALAKPKIAPRVIPAHSADFAKVVKEETQETDRILGETNQMLATIPNGATIEIEATEDNIDDSEAKLSLLVDDNFPFDDTQITAIYGLAQEQYGCLIGAAGTGKTTTTKKLVDILRKGLPEVDMSQYWTRGEPDDADDEYETPQKLIPSIVMVSFTGRATQMIKKNFPRDWHGNIMTIHRALGFYPEFYPELDEATGQMVNKRRFVPAYNEDNIMPWDIIVIDETGMLGLELWHQLWAATKGSCRIIMIGDINQLPPTHGKSVLGFALAKWPTWELTHVHRQQGANNSIVDNAHRVLKGIRPVSDSPKQLSLNNQESMVETLNYLVHDKDWRFLTIDVDEEHRKASTRIRQVMQLIQGKLYEPNRDVIITPINGHEVTQPGYSLGQVPMNQELVVKLNSANPRYIIDAGREKVNFAEGDKVMATVNDYEAGITNGMTGIITSITPNGAYIGDTNRWGLINEVNDYLSGLAEDDGSDEEFTLESMVADAQLGMDELKKREKKDAGPASHIIEVQFGEGDHGFKISFSTKSTVASLMLAYVATCHKMQGGECPIVFVICHQGHRGSLKREWLYTAITRASERCVVFTTRQGVGFAVGKQSIRGSTLKQKVQTFIDLTKVGLVGASVRVKLPLARSLDNTTRYSPEERKEHEEAQQRESQPAVTEQRATPQTTINVKNLTIHVHESVAQPGAESVSGTAASQEPSAAHDSELRDGGEDSGIIDGTYTEVVEPARIESRRPDPSPESLPFHGVSWGQRNHDGWVAGLKVPAPTPKPVEAPKKLTLGQLLARKKGLK